MGYSIFSDKKQDLSLMQFNDRYALRVKDKVAVIRPKKEPMTFIYKLNTYISDLFLFGHLGAFNVICHYLLL